MQTPTEYLEATRIKLTTSSLDKSLGHCMTILSHEIYACQPDQATRTGSISTDPASHKPSTSTHGTARILPTSLPCYLPLDLPTARPILTVHQLLLLILVLTHLDPPKFFPQFQHLPPLQFNLPHSSLHRLISIFQGPFPCEASHARPSAA